MERGKIVVTRPKSLVILSGEALMSGKFTPVGLQHRIRFGAGAQKVKATF
jgi:hypothetical protein